MISKTELIERITIKCTLGQFKDQIKRLTDEGAHVVRSGPKTGDTMQIVAERHTGYAK